MRLLAGDPDAERATVYWQGLPMELCTAVDTDEGWADFIAVDDDGRIISDGDGPRIVRMRGSFVVRFDA